MASETVKQRMALALEAASDTRELRIGGGVLAEAAEVFGRSFGRRPTAVVADVNTFQVAGRQVMDVMARAGWEVLEPLVFDDPHLHAHHDHVETIQGMLEPHDAIPIAVGSGTINDLTKLASHRCDRPYMVVATAASMDGYTAFGASITTEGSKQTFFCPAPRAVVADMDVICSAPGELNAAGYADLIAKTSAGADWLLADALGIEPIDAQAWAMVQKHLRAWINQPDGVRRGERPAIEGLVEGLLMTGFAMQWCKSSRPASGAEHQFSHLWDMQDHRHHGQTPLHGYKVGIGTLASTGLYEQLMAAPIEDLDVERVSATWPGIEELKRQVEGTHALPELRAVAWRESEAKYIDAAQAGRLMSRLKAVWPDLRVRLREQVVPSTELRDMLRLAGAPYEPAMIGIDSARLRQSCIEAQQIRRRFTVLDLAMLTGLMPWCLDQLFGLDGR